MKKKLISLLLATSMVAALVGCGKKEEKKDKDSYVVGICQLTEHAALDAATKGFKDALTEKLGDKVEFIEQNAQGETTTCATIVNGLVSKKVDLIMANATPALQAAANATVTIPILGTSVTEYGVALGIDNFSGTVGGNISGTSDLAPLDKQADMVKELLPDAKTIGLVYCSGEANSKYQVEKVEEYLKALGYACKTYPFADSNDISSVVTKAVGEVDAIYVPTDNKVADNATILDSICTNANIPVIAGEEGIAKGCGIATLSISYYDLGYATGLMAAKILTGEADISKMPVEYVTTFTKKYVPSRCKALGIEVSDDYVAIEE